ncbi:hypothetical protein GCM10009734_03600 [Nonomuraea bangladeshensis]
MVKGHLQPEPDTKISQADKPETPMAEAKKKGWIDLIQIWIGIATGMIALLLSIINWASLNRKPELTLSLPPLIRIAQADDVWLYLQPTFSTTTKTETTDYITGMELQVRPRTAPAASTNLVWDETGTWVYDPTKQETTWAYESDPEPLLVTQDSPRSPIILFSVDNWQFRPGRYELELRATRSSTPSPLSVTFCLDIDANNEATFKRGGQYRWRAFRRSPTGSTQPATEACYRA